MDSLFTGGIELLATNRTEVIIVGAGLAGLTAAMELQKHQVPFVVLEARDRVGGRIYSRIEDGVAIDFGAQWISRKQPRVNAMMRKFGLSAIPTFSEGLTYYELLGRKRRTASSVPPVPLPALFDSFRLRRSVKRMCSRIDVSAPWHSPEAPNLDAQTVHTWLDQGMFTKQGKAYCRNVAEEVLCGELSEISMLDLLWSLASYGGPDGILRAEDGWLPEGAQALPERMAASLGDRVRLCSPVRTIEWSESGVTASTDEISWHAGRIIMAMPPALAGRVRYEPPLPFMRDQLTQRLGMGSVFKFILVYDKPFWRKRGWNGDSYMDDGPIKATLDSSMSGQSKGVLSAFSSGRDARILGQLSPEERRRRVLDSLVRPYGSEALRPERFYEYDWMNDPWARGGYGAHFAPGVLSQYGPALLQAVGPIHWAGTETATEWRLYMEGAMQSGERAAAEVLEALRSR